MAYGTIPHISLKTAATLAASVLSKNADVFSKQKYPEEKDTPASPDARPILIYPDERLKTIATPVVFDEQGKKELETICNQLIATLDTFPNGVGLAATQIDQHKRVIHLRLDRITHSRYNYSDAILDYASKLPRYWSKEPPHALLVNPEVIVTSDRRKQYEEGCLSLPDIRDNIERPLDIDVTFQDIEGDYHSINNPQGLLRVVLLHEIDHLNGICFPDTDSVNEQRRKKIIKRLRRL